MITNETVRKIEQAHDLLLQAREELKEYGASIPADRGWADPHMSDLQEQREQQQAAITAVNSMLRSLPVAKAEVSSIWERLGKPEATATPMIEWKAGPFASIRGTVGGIGAFTINWHTRREDPDYFLRAEFPGMDNAQARDDDPGKLKAIAEERLATWLARITGNDPAS